MKIIFENIIQDLNNTDERNFNSKSLVSMSKENSSDSKNSIIFDFIFDNNGDYSYTTNKHGFGKNVNVRGRITTPEDGIYSVNIKSSDGGGGQWDGVKANQEVLCVINTSLWHETTITINIHSNKTKCSGKALIDYYL